jgi:hypothetical protein
LLGGGHGSHPTVSPDLISFGVGLVLVGSDKKNFGFVLVLFFAPWPAEDLLL